MRLEEALAESNLGSAKRPHYSLPVEPEIDKVIISIGYLDDVYVAHADSGKRVSYIETDDIPAWKYTGREDWEPITLNRPEVKEQNSNATENSTDRPETPDEPIAIPMD